MEAGRVLKLGKCDSRLWTQSAGDGPLESFTSYIRWGQEVRRDFSDILHAAFITTTSTLLHRVSIIFKLGRYGVSLGALAQLAPEFPSLFSPMAMEAVLALSKAPFSVCDLPLEAVFQMSRWRPRRSTVSD